MSIPTKLSALALGLGLAWVQPACAAGPETMAGAPGSVETVKLSAEQIAAAAHIEVAPAGPGNLLRTVRVPGNVMMDPDLIGHVPAKVIGTIIELRKRLGDTVQKGEIVAYLESREVADAKSEFLTAGSNLQLQTNLFERERTLFEKKISAEQQFCVRRTPLRFQNCVTIWLAKTLRARCRRRRNRRASEAAGREFAALCAALADRRPRDRAESGSRRAGRRGPAGKGSYVIADMSSVWVELIASAPDLALLKEGDSMRSRTRRTRKLSARRSLISPMVSSDTRTTRVIVSLDNADGRWRPGSFVSASIPLERRAVGLLLPKARCR
jgi:cobalt-zinc-cadmium efflux system membrane fusion protein